MNALWVDNSSHLLAKTGTKSVEESGDGNSETRRASGLKIFNVSLPFKDKHKCHQHRCQHTDTLFQDLWATSKVSAVLFTGEPSTKVSLILNSPLYHKQTIGFPREVWKSTFGLKLTNVLVVVSQLVVGPDSPVAHTSPK